MGLLRRSTIENKTAQKLEQLKNILIGKKALLIVMQDFPDPDALASAAALRELAHVLSGTPCTVTSGGSFGRSENAALARYLRLPYHRLKKIDPVNYDVIAMVDTQPETGNNSLPAEVAVQIVIDHHPIRRATRSVPFTDIRNQYGACSTILFEYLTGAGIDIDTPTATALLYGIRSDTQDMGRESRKADIDAFVALYPVANKRMLGEIQKSKTSPSYFKLLSTALLNSRVYGRTLISNAGIIDIPDILGEIADLMLRNEEIDWALCYGFYDNRMLISLRTSDSKGDSGAIIRRIVSGQGTGGGHRTMAGGQIPLKEGSADEKKKTEELVQKRYLKALKSSDRKGISLLKLNPTTKDEKS